MQTQLHWTFGVFSIYYLWLWDNVKQNKFHSLFFVFLNADINIDCYRYYLRTVVGLQVAFSAFVFLPSTSLKSIDLCVFSNMKVFNLNKRLLWETRLALAASATLLRRKYSVRWITFNVQSTSLFKLHFDFQVLVQLSDQLKNCSPFKFNLHGSILGIII